MNPVTVAPAQKAAIRPTTCLFDVCPPIALPIKVPARNDMLDPRTKFFAVNNNVVTVRDGETTSPELVEESPRCRFGDISIFFVFFLGPFCQIVQSRVL